MLASDCTVSKAHLLHGQHALRLYHLLDEPTLHHFRTFLPSPRWLQRCSEDKLRVQSSLRPWLALKNLLTTNPHGRSGALVPTLNIPMCICHGTADKAAPVYSSVHLYCHSATAFESKLLRLYAGAAHNLFADLKREELMSDWIRFAKDAVSQRTLASGSEDGGNTGGV